MAVLEKFCDGGFTVKELREALAEFPDDAYIAIGHLVPQRIALSDPARVVESYFNVECLAAKKGKATKKIVRFSYQTELSDGTIVDVDFF